MPSWPGRAPARWPWRRGRGRRVAESTVSTSSRGSSSSLTRMPRAGTSVARAVRGGRPAGLGLARPRRSGRRRSRWTPTADPIVWQVVGEGEVRWLAGRGGRSPSSRPGRHVRRPRRRRVREDRPRLAARSGRDVPQPRLVRRVPGTGPRHPAGAPRAARGASRSGSCPATCPGCSMRRGSRVGRFLGADPEGLAFVTNATTGYNTVLQSLRFEPGDELLTNDHEYNATINAMRAVAARDGARGRRRADPLPDRRPRRRVCDAILGAVTAAHAARRRQPCHQPDRAHPPGRASSSRS